MGRKQIYDPAELTLQKLHAVDTLLAMLGSFIAITSV
jgi:hypothetical protein